MSELAIAGSVQLSLDDLAAEANREHALARQAGEAMIEHAIRAGLALIAAKAQVRHGEWLAWLAKNFDGSEVTAQRFMRVASNPSRVTDLDEPSLRNALKAVSGKDEMDVHYSSESPEWATPQSLFDELNRESLPEQYPYSQDRGRVK